MSSSTAACVHGRVHGERDPDARVVRARLPFPAMLAERVAVVRQHDDHGVVQAARRARRRSSGAPRRRRATSRPPVAGPRATRCAARRSGRAARAPRAARRAAHRRRWGAPRPTGRHGAGVACGGDPRRMRGARGEERGRTAGSRAPCARSRSPVPRASRSRSDARTPGDPWSTHGSRGRPSPRSGSPSPGIGPSPAGRTGPGRTGSVEVLADEPRSVAGVVQPGRERGGFVEAVAVVVVQDAGVPGERPVNRLALAGQHSGVFANAFGNAVHPEPARASSALSHGIAANVPAAWSSVSTTITFGRSSGLPSSAGHTTATPSPISARRAAPAIRRPGGPGLTPSAPSRCARRGTPEPTRAARSRHTSWSRRRAAGARSGPRPRGRSRGTGGSSPRT